MRWETGPEAARPHCMAGASLGQLNLKSFCPEPRLPGWALPPITLNLDSETGSGEPSPTCLQVAPRRGEGTPGHARAVACRASRTGSSEGWGAVAWSTPTSGQGCPTPASEQLLTYHFTGPHLFCILPSVSWSSSQTRVLIAQGVVPQDPTARRAEEAKGRRAVGMPSPTWGCQRATPLAVEVGAGGRAGKPLHIFAKMASHVMFHKRGVRLNTPIFMIGGVVLGLGMIRP